MENSKIKGLKPLVETDFVSLYDVECKNKKGQEKLWMVSSRKSKEELEKVYLENKYSKKDYNNIKKISEYKLKNYLDFLKIINKL